MHGYINEPKIAGWTKFQSRSEESETNPDVIVVGVPFEGGSGAKKGASQGPDNIRLYAQRMKTIDQRGYDFSRLRVRDLGDVATLKYDLEATVGRLFRVYGELFEVVRCPILTLGGDHSITYPIVQAASKHKRIGLLWFDAHPDMLDVYQDSHFSHGSPLRRVLESGSVSACDTLLVGTRAYDPGEIDYINEKQIQELKAVSFYEDPHGTISTFRQRLSEIQSRVENFYVSIDIDVLDDCYVPGAATPVSGGISTSMLFRLISEIPGNGIGFDIVEFAQSIGLDDITGRSVTAIIVQLMSRIAMSCST
jgi:agmatinase